MDRNNKTILLNTIVMYVRLIITTIIGLLSSRYVLQALGASDFGLYAVVGGIISMLGVINTAMHTTTRRYINVEMGKPDGNMNKIFNISRLLHFGFAIFIFIMAETVGMFYIYNYLNIDPDKLFDAIFVFQISTITAAISIINIPYQALLQAFEKFTQVAIFDIISSISKLAFVIYLLSVKGNVLCIYAIGMSGLTLLSLFFYSIACKIQWKDIVKYKIYKDLRLYKDILFFNNYVALGASACLGRNQGSTLLINYFFGTIANAAFAVGFSVESYCSMFVGNISSAAAPQITQNYSEKYERSIFLTELLNKISIYLMMVIVLPLILEMDFILHLWLKNVPEGATLICQLTLISALCRTIFGGMDKLIQASGKIRWFQIVSSIMDLSCLPISFILFKIGQPAYSIIIVYILMTISGSSVIYLMMSRILSFNIPIYAKHVLMPAVKVVVFLVCLSYFYQLLEFDANFFHLLGMAVVFIVTIIIIYVLGLNNNEKQLTSQIVFSRILKVIK